jgi:hypothetical protein
MADYWTTNKSESLVDERRADLDLLVRFVNADIHQDETQSLQANVLERLRLHPALHPDNRQWMTDEDPTSVAKSLQRHLSSRFGAITANSKHLWEMPLWRINGSVSFTLHPIEQRFLERFQLRKFKSGNEISALKKILDLWLIEIIRDLDFRPRRFGQCPRCGSFFYSPTAKERTYCSKRCGGAARQEKFRKERRGQDN